MANSVSSLMVEGKKRAFHTHTHTKGWKSVTKEMQTYLQAFQHTHKLKQSFFYCRLCNMLLVSRGSSLVSEREKIASDPQVEFSVCVCNWVWYMCVSCSLTFASMRVGVLHLYLPTSCVWAVIYLQEDPCGSFTYT